MPRDPSAILALLVAVAAIGTGGLMVAGLIAPAVEPSLRLAFGGVLVLYGLYRLTAYWGRSRSRDNED